VKSKRMLFVVCVAVCNIIIPLTVIISYACFQASADELTGYDIWFLIYVVLNVFTPVSFVFQFDFFTPFKVSLKIQRWKCAIQGQDIQIYNVKNDKDFKFLVD